MPDTVCDNAAMFSNPFLAEDKSYYRATFRAYGNIDHDESPYLLVCPPLEVISADIDDIVRSMQEYIHRYSLGAGNMSAVTVSQNNKPVAEIYYNGRVQYI